MRWRRPGEFGILAVSFLVGLAWDPMFAGERPSSIRQGHYRDLRAVDFGKLFTDESGDSLQEAEVETRYVDLTGDGREEAVVTGWNFDGGDGGPNVESIFTLDGAGALLELEIADPPVTFRGRDVYGSLVGNRWAEVVVDGGSFREIFHDSTGRGLDDPPLVLSYAWDGKRFVVSSVQWAKSFPASFDCDKAGNDAEKTVCAREDLAALDRRVVATYKQVLAGLPRPQAERLRQGQIDWLKQRDLCGTQRNPSDCVQDAYQRRVVDLATEYPWAATPARDKKKR